MNEHRRILGIIYLAWGLLDLFLLTLGLIFATRWLPIIVDDPEAYFVSDLLSIIFISLMIFKSIPCIIGGTGLLYQKKWAEALVLIIGCIALFFFPIGTAIGVYTIFVYVQDRKNAEKIETGEYQS